MNRVLLCLLLLLESHFCFAQNFKYISVENGLSNREVYSIQKDLKGYIWFLTHEGIDRFDGKVFTHYKLAIGNREINSFANLNRLHRDTLGCIWEIGKNGQIFKYNEQLDQFQIMALLDENNKKMEQPFSYAHIDKSNHIWLCTPAKQFIFNINTGKFRCLKSDVELNINNIIQIDAHNYYMGTSNGICLTTMKNDSLHIIRQKDLDTLNIQVNALYYNKKFKKLIIGSFLRGVFVFDTQSQQLHHIKTDLEDVNISCIKALNDTDILVGTDGAGIYKLEIRDNTLKPYIVANYNEPNEMNGNNINDIYIDGNERIWIANYPIGITMLNMQFPNYKWTKHAIGNPNTLINDQVNTIIEDHDGDIWYGTNNGISCYHRKNKTWTHLLSSFHSDAKNKNHIFISLCEILPGVIMVGGYTSGMYWIEKKNMIPRYFVPNVLSFGKGIKPDKYIKAIYKDSKGYIWTGGYYNLKRFNLKQRSIEA